MRIPDGAKMQFLKYLLLGMALLGYAAPQVSAQIQGRVIDAQNQEPLVGAIVKVEVLNIGALTDSLGRFEFTNPRDATQVTLQVSFAGYEPKTIFAKPGQPLTISLQSHETEGLEITTQRRTFEYANTAFRTELVSRQFMQSIPGNNNLMETIDYVNGMRQQVNCGVCGTNDIHINGMEGPYTLVLIDGMPIVSALGSVYGLNGIPQSMIERIEIIKGPATAMFGAEAMGGVVNIVTRDPRNMPLLSISGYGTSQTEGNLDLAVNAKIGKLRSLLSGNYYHMQRRLDRNADNFTDIPLSQRLSLFNKWILDRTQGRIAQLALKYYDEDRFGGQMQWQPENKGSDSVYGESIQTRRLEALGTYQLPLKKEDVRLDVSAAHHFQDSYYGTTHFLARQFTGYAAIIWMKEKGRHKLQNGATYRYNYYQDNTPATALGSDQSALPGVFVQDEVALHPRWSVLAGARLDYHPKHGPIFSPRLNLRWKPTAFTNVRLTAGRGFRTVNLFTEEHAALTGARAVVIEGKLAPERSYNLNLNFNHVFNIGESAVTVDVDAFYAHFSNRILPDYETDPSLIIYKNLNGFSEIRGLSGKWSQSFKFPLSVDLGGTWMQSFVEEDGELRAAQLLTPIFQGVFNLGYKFTKLRSTLSYTGKVIGPMHLPTYDAPFERPTRSDWFTEQNIQISSDLGRGLSLQLGCRNLFNYTQPSPLVDPAHPFSDSFDTAYAYGPLQTRRIVVGMGWQMQRKRS